MSRNRRTKTEHADSIRQSFITGLADAIGANQRKLDKDSPWAERPVSLKTFCNKMVGEPLFDEQYKLGVKIFGTDPMAFDTKYLEFDAFWGKGSGKDRSVAKYQAYLIYKLMCLKNPQKYLRDNYGCSIADGDAIDLANMSINARQAQNVFFKKFKSVIKMVKDLDTGENWFAARGMDLRDGYDMQNTEANFPKAISAHSLNSETNIGEGLSLIFCTLDEFGSFRMDNAMDLKESVESSIRSRFKDVGKLCVLSFMYYPDDPMDVLFKKNESNLKVYCSKLATWQVNSLIDKNDFANDYARNPEKSRMRYECIGTGNTSGFVTKPYMLSKMFTRERENPIVGELITIDSTQLMTLEFKDFFRGNPDKYYIIHGDLATGADKRDCGSIAMGHLEGMIPKIDPKLAREISKTGMLLDANLFGEDKETLRKGVVIDLAIQLTSKDEIVLSDVRKFVLTRLREQLGFQIILVTYDGWQSKDSIQLFQAQGIDSKVFSVDKNNDAYDTWKSLMYQQLVKCYPHDIAVREAKELIITGTGKVDHPKKSYNRLLAEGREEGSKDIMDCIVAVCDNVNSLLSLDADVFFG